MLILTGVYTCCFLQEQEEQSTASLLNGIAELGPSTPVLCCSQGCRVRAGLYLEDQKTQPKTPGRTDKNICKGHSWNLSGAPGEGWEPEPGLSAAGSSSSGSPLSISKSVPRLSCLGGSHKLYHVKYVASAKRTLWN